MNAEILCIGTELVLGDIVNTNAQYLSQQLAQKGIDVFYQSSIGDNPERIIKSLSVAVTRSNLIIFTGGLGPTADDITISTVANALNIPLEKNQDALNKMKEYFEKTGKEFTQNNEKQALLPKGCIVLPNDIGTAPGCIIESGNQKIVFLPGPPSELKVMYENYLSKYLEQYSNSIIKSKFVRIYGVSESMIDTMADSLIKGINPTVAPYAADGETKLRVTAKAKDEQTANKMIDETVKQIEDIFGANVYGYDDDTLESVIVSLLKEKKLTVATAESCTAGYISKRITDISGASTVFNMGVSTYSNESKTNELGVPADLIEKHGAVSEEVASSMAKGVRLKSKSDIGLSITGIAGPKSDDSQKPVGLSFIGISTKDGEFVIKSMKGENKDREYIRYASASEALNLLRLYLINGKRGLKAKRVEAQLITEAQKDSIQFEPIEMNIQPNDETELKDEKPVNKSRTLNISRPIMLDPREFTDVSVGESEDEGFVSETVSFEHFKEIKPKNKEVKDFKISIDENEYTPYEDEEYVALDIELQQYEKEIEKQMEKGFFKSKLIKKDDTPAEKARKISFFVALILLIVALLNIAFYFINPFIQGLKVSNAAKEIHAAEQVRNYNSPIMNPKFTSLYSKNSDIIGWIKIKGTNIDYPVMQNVQDDFYLRKGFDKSYSREGSIFADGKTSIVYQKESKNIVLYGHNMISTGTMFRQLEKYLQLDFYRKRPTIMFDSLYRDSDYKIFAVFITNAIKSQDNGNYFDYAQNTWKSEQEFNNWIEEVKLRSVISTNIDVNYDDELLTLQTCNESFESEDEKARLVVMARRVRQGESVTTDTSKAVINQKAKYPQMWYDVNGLSNPYFDEQQPTTPPKPSKPTKTSATSTSAASTSVTSTSQVASTIKPITTTTAKKTSVQTTQKPSKTKAPKPTKPSKTTQVINTEPTVITSQPTSENNE